MNETPDLGSRNRWKTQAIKLEWAAKRRQAFKIRSPCDTARSQKKSPKKVKITVPSTPRKIRGLS